MTGYFSNKVVAVTGGTDGIGKALVDRLLSQGAKVATCSRHHDKLYGLQSEYPSYPLHTVVADVSSENDCRRFNDGLSRIVIIELLLRRTLACLPVGWCVPYCY